MTYPLAVCVPVPGLPSEQFIRRHVEQLLPGGTVVVARRPAAHGAATWSTTAPTLYLDPLLDEWGGEREQAAVAAFLRDHGVRAVLAEYLDIWLPFLRAFAEVGARCVAHAHGYDVSQRLRDGYWRAAYLAYADVARLVTMSRHSAGRLAGIGLPERLLAVVPYGVDVPPAVLRTPRPAVHVLMVGRLVAKKSPLATLEACRRAAANGAPIRLTVVGDGPLLPDVRARADRTGCPVEICGAQPNAAVLRLMRDADVFCQHSVVDPATGDEEGLPVAILEAMATGLPVVSTRHAGIPEAVDDGRSGYLVEEGDVAAMADRVGVLAADIDLRARMGAAGRAIVRQRFSWPGERAALLDMLGVEG